VPLRGSYQGSSFFELIQTDVPHLAPDLKAWGRSVAEGALESMTARIPHGTTVLAFRYGDGVLVAGDRLATAGHSVASRDVVKVFETDPYSLMAISGAAGPSIEMARILSVELEHYEKIEGEPLELEGKANKLSQMIRANLPAAMQGLAVVPLFAGFDTRRKTGRLWKYDITGGRYEEAEFDATGSGGLYARESLKHGWAATLQRDEAIRAAVAALTAAADEDRATGGVDLERGIYPIIKLCTSEGHGDASEEEIAGCYRSILEARSAGGNL
jgi:proteasome beta subunit